MKDYVALPGSSNKKVALKWVLGLAAVLGLVALCSQTEQAIQLKGYVENEMFVSYMDEKFMTLDNPMEEVYDEESDLMNAQDELVGVAHVFDEEKNELVPLVDVDKQVTKTPPLVIGVNSGDRIYFLAPGNKWILKSGGLKNIALGVDGTIWGVNKLDYIYRFDLQCETWTRIPGLLKQIDVGRKNLVWGVNKNDYIYRWTGSAWQNIGGRLKVVSVAADGNVWGVNSADYIYRWYQGRWEQVCGRLKQISVGSATQIWGVNSADNIYRWTGAAWQQIAGKLKWVCVGPTGRVWGVNKDDTIFYRFGSAWRSIPGKLKQIDCR